MRKFLLGVLVILAVGVAYAYPKVSIVGYEATGHTAKNLCSGHFVSGFSGQQMMDEAIVPASSVLRRTSHQFDERNMFVDVTLMGLFKRRAVFAPGIGCTLLAPGQLERDFAVTPIMPFAAPSNAPWPAGNGAANRDLAAVNYDALDAAINEAFAEPYLPDRRNTKAVVVIYNGELIAEQYATGVDLATPLHSWSMAKSVTNMQVGILVGRGDLDLMAPAPIPEWQGADDPRGDVSLDQLLRMSSGLEFDETYALDSDATRMLALVPDAGGFAASKPLAYEPDTHWAYSSGTTNILSRMIRQTVGGSTQDHYSFVQENLFLPIGATTAIFEPDASGTFISSSYMYASARDWARLGQLALQDGVWNGARILPAGWMDYSVAPTPTTDLNIYGAQFWLNLNPDRDGRDRYWPTVPTDAFSMNGYQGQYTISIPSEGLVIVRMGFTPDTSLAGVNELVSGIIAAIDD